MITPHRLSMCLVAIRSNRLEYFVIVNFKVKGRRNFRLLRGSGDLFVPCSSMNIIKHSHFLKCTDLVLKFHKIFLIQV